MRDSFHLAKLKGLILTPQLKFCGYGMEERRRCTTRRSLFVLLIASPSKTRNNSDEAMFVWLICCGFMQVIIAYIYGFFVALIFLFDVSFFLCLAMYVCVCVCEILQSV